MFGAPTPIVLNLIIINILVYISASILGFGANEMLSLHYIDSGAFNPIQFFTYMFVHANGRHVLGNMIGLFFFGPVLEMHWGSKKFLTYYIVCGVGAGVLYSGYVYFDVALIKEAANAYIGHPTAEAFANFMNKNVHEIYLQNYSFINAFAKDPQNANYINESVEFVKSVYLAKTRSTMLGASGALYAVLLAVGMIFPNKEAYPVPLKMAYVVAIYGLVSVYGMIQNRPGDNVAHFAHLSGMIVGFILLKVWGEKRANYY